MTNSAPTPCRDEIRESIPWYVNGTLSDAALTALCEHIAGCSDCQADLELHTDMRASVLGRELTPMIPAARPEQIIGIGGSSRGQPSRLPQVTWRVVAVAAGIAFLGVALVLSLYPGQDANLNNQLFQTATSTGPLGGMDYVLQLQFEDGIPKTEGGQIVSELDGMTKWTINDSGVYEVHVRLTGASLQTLQDYEKHMRALPGVKSAKFTALQLPIR